MVSFQFSGDDRQNIPTDNRHQDRSLGPTSHFSATSPVYLGYWKLGAFDTSK